MCDQGFLALTILANGRRAIDKLATPHFELAGIVLDRLVFEPTERATNDAIALVANRLSTLRTTRAYRILEDVRKLNVLDAAVDAPKPHAFRAANDATVFQHRVIFQYEQRLTILALGISVLPAVGFALHIKDFVVDDDRFLHVDDVAGLLRELWPGLLAPRMDGGKE